MITWKKKQGYTKRKDKEKRERGKKGETGSTQEGGGRGSMKQGEYRK